MADGSDGTFQKILTSSGIVLVGTVFHLGLEFLARIIIARLLGKVDYGAVSLGYTLLITVSMVVVIGTDTGVGRYLPRFSEPERRRGVLLSAYQVIVPFGVVAGALIVILAEPLATSVFNKPEMAPIFQVFGLAVPFSAFMKVTIGSVRGMQQSLPRVYIQNFALPVSRFVLIAVALVLGFRSIGVAWAYAGAQAIAAAFSLYYLYEHTPLFETVEPVPMRRELLLFSAPLMVTATMNILFHNFDTFMLGALDTTGSVGIYNGVYPVAQFLTATLTSFGFIFMPIISEFQSSGEMGEMRRTYQVVSKWIFFVTLPVFLVFAFFPAPVIRATFGAEFLAGDLTLTVLSVGFFVHTVAGLNGNTLTAIGKTRIIMYDNLFVVVLNIALNLVLIPRYSFLGAAVATTIGFVLMNGLYLIQLYRATGTHPFRRETFVPGAITTTLWAGLSVALRPFIPDATVIMVVEIVAFVALYPLIILRFGGIEAEDIDLLNAFEARAGIDLGRLRRLARQFVN